MPQLLSTWPQDKVTLLAFPSLLRTLITNTSKGLFVVLEEMFVEVTDGDLRKLPTFLAEIKSSCSIFFF
jgi:hypothetical protein